MTWAKHTEKDAANPYLQLDYTHNARDLITQIIETDANLVQTTVTFTYDNWARLLSERRVGANPYDLAYTYDAGGNRLTKTEVLKNKLTTYYYDTDPLNLPTWIEPPGGRANRLLGYEETWISPPNLIVRVKYDYFMEGHAAGNVAQIRHLYRISETNDGTTTVTTYFARGPVFEYNKMGELWLAKQREWTETHTVDNATGLLTVAPIATADVTTKDVVDFRGAGRKRWMVRHRETGWPHKPLYDSAVWTDYEGAQPLGDYTVTVAGNPIVATKTAGQFYALGFAQVDAAGQVLYEHADQIGSTRAMSDAAGVVQRTFVYTAFGEPINDTGTFNTRYQYAGKHGYESFGSLGSDFPFPYMHTGARWYNPETGRFLQRDPNGLVLMFDFLEQPTRVPGDLNVYQYAASSPTMALDSEGEAWWIWAAKGVQKGAGWLWRRIPTRYSKHAFDKMMKCNLTKTVINNAIRHGVSFAGKYPRTTKFVYENVVVVRNWWGKVVTAWNTGH